MKTMNFSLIRILFALVIGLVLVLWPDAAVDYIVITVGIAFLLPGVISLIGYFSRKKRKTEYRLVFQLRESVVCYLVFG